MDSRKDRSRSKEETWNRMKLREVISRSTDYLSDVSSTPRLEAELIVAHSVGKDRLWLYMNMDSNIEEVQLERIRKMLKSRKKGEPIHFLLGFKEFMTLKFKVEKGVFIPRFETEELVEKVVLISREMGYKKFLDLGTGVGTIAISIAKFVDGSSVLAVDKSEKALELAEKNAKLNNINNISLHMGDMVEFLRKVDDGDFEVLVSNPPYLSESEWEDLEPGIKEYEPKEAFVAGKDGMRYYRMIVETVVNFERKKVFLEISPPRKEGVVKLMEEFGLDYEIWDDLSGKPRILFFET